MSSLASAVTECEKEAQGWELALNTPSPLCVTTGPSPASSYNVQDKHLKGFTSTIKNRTKKGNVLSEL